MGSQVQNAIVITVGDEILSGRVLSQDLAIVAIWLERYGVRVIREVAVGDDEDSIADAIRVSFGPKVFVVVTGGLGPTEDDLTRRAAANALSLPLEFCDDLFETIRRKLKSLGIPETKVHRNYGFIPGDFRPLDNPSGLAPGLLYSASSGHILLLPGVPAEVRSILDSLDAEELPLLEGASMDRVRVRTYGLRETQIVETLRPHMEELRPIHFLPSLDLVDLDLESRDTGGSGLEERVRLLEHALGDAVYGKEDDTLQNVVGTQLMRLGFRAATAESCTGGLVAKLLTDVPGSSDFFEGSVVAYDNRVKTSVLGVSETELEGHGAVSETVARGMAEGIRDLLGVDVGLSTTGIAGPGGGTPEKPVGLVYMGVALPEGTRVQKEIFKGNRERVRRSTALCLLNWLRLELTKRKG
jgi:nicotinamide-nucleotide amidase